MKLNFYQVDYIDVATPGVVKIIAIPGFVDSRDYGDTVNFSEFTVDPYGYAQRLKMVAASEEVALLLLESKPVFRMVERRTMEFMVDFMPKRYGLPEDFVLDYIW